MSRTTIELKLPEGYELDDGEQPRFVEAGEMILMFYDNGGLSYGVAGDELVDSKRFILRKIKPREYHVVVGPSGSPILWNGFRSRQTAEQWAAANNGRAVTLIEKPEEPAP